MDEHMAAVDALLAELDVADRPTILVLNKMDRVEERRPAEVLLAARGGVTVSAVTGEGLDRLRGAIDSAQRPFGAPVTLRIPHGDGAALALCYEHGRVRSRVDGDGHVTLEAELPPRLLTTLAPYRQ
jgi:GTP-binding protein HflX